MGNAAQNAPVVMGPEGLDATEQPIFGDWRDAYLVCPHLRGPTPPEIGTGNVKKNGARIACVACWPEYLFPDAKPCVRCGQGHRTIQCLDGLDPLTGDRTLRPLPDETSSGPAPHQAAKGSETPAGHSPREGGKPKP